MNRRKSIGLFGVGSLLLIPSTLPSRFSQTKDAGQAEGFKEAFQTRWEGLRMHTFEVFDAMPHDQLDFRPTREVMSFSKLFSHIGHSLDIYAEILDGTEKIAEPKPEDKETVMAYLQTRFERFEAAFQQLNGSDLYDPKYVADTIDGEIHSSDYDILMLAYNHTVHHKGQATTYLRLQGIVPPQYRF
jgi:uncharacterized damage-inducible protein DinB